MLGSRERPTFAQRTLGLGVRLLARLQSDARLLARLERAAGALVEVARAVPDDAGRAVQTWPRLAHVEPEAREWSLYMLLEHLRVVQRGIADIIDTLAGGWSFATPIQIDYADPALSSGREALDEFARATAHVAKVIRRHGDPDRDLRLPGQKTHAHPWFGRLTAHQWHAVLMLYLHLRLGQARRLYRSPHAGPETRG